MSIFQGYGMTETSTIVSMGAFGRKQGVLGCAGQLVNNTEARILKGDGKYADYDEIGELHVRGPQMALEYFQNPAATKETFDDGWVRTGDVVFLKRNGDLFVVDRLKEFMKVRGFQVAPAELEGHLFNHPDVDDVGVVSIEDEFSGELPVAFIVLSETIAKRIEQDKEESEKVKASIKKHVQDKKVNYKWLHDVQFISAIPKNPSGKILRRHLREQARAMYKKSGNQKAQL